MYSMKRLSTGAAVKALLRSERPAFASRHQLFQRNLHYQARPLIQRTSPAITRTHIVQQLRHESNTPRPLTDRAETASEPNKDREEPPSYQMTFTCRKCAERSTHKITKQGYHHGTILITCPGCKNRHLISDHLQIFSDKGITLEDIMKEKGELIKKGVLGSEGDVEFYRDEEPGDGKA